MGHKLTQGDYEWKSRWIFTR